MMTGKISAHINAAQNVQNWLRDKGCEVMNVHFFARRPVLEVCCPPASLVASASRITESYKGGTRSVWVTSVEGCRVIWR